MADLDVATLASARRLVIIATTWGEGDPPARTIRAYGELMAEGAARLDGVPFNVLALGGKRVADRVDCDRDFAAPGAGWRWH
jgi:sulfite reductase (NADPH) flavoprotein alpha-component|uniref:hypothetical protein n=1 Tax=unclassified Polaromonas TaxID=2638319 RepID=UPI002103C10D|nr:MULTISPECIES: hypothetical protein [unclassified Polaromonas]